MDKRKGTNGENLGTTTERHKDKPAYSGSGKLEIGKVQGIEKLDDFQKEVIEYNGNIALKAGRQVGKSVAISIKAAHAALENRKYSVMIISATERQAYLLFHKVLTYLDDNFKWSVKKGRDRPTKTEIKLTNGSIIRCLPTGLDGLGIRGYTINMLIADEAAFIPQAVFPAVTPALSTTGGKIILLSTPFGRQGYFYEAFNNPQFKTWSINAEEIAEQRAEPQRTYLKEFHNAEKLRMSKLEYAQEYLGEFVDELRQFFTDDLIKKCCVLRRPEKSQKNAINMLDYYLGVDIARMGYDESSFEILQKMDPNRLYQIENITTKKTLTTDTYDKILELDSYFNFKKIGIDAGSGSLGVGILDFLLRQPIIRKKIVALNNLARTLDHRGERKRALLKEDMYLNMLSLMEKGYLKLLDDDDLIASLRSVQYEYVLQNEQPTRMRIFGKYTHIAEGLIRASWLANQKSINTRIYWV